MGINKKLKLIAGYFLDKRKENNISYNELEIYIEKFNRTDDYFERSYYQYKCQVLLQGKIFHFFSNVAAWVLYPFIILRIKKTKGVDVNSEYKDAVFNCYDIDKNILPSSLEKEYENIYYNEKMENYYYNGVLNKFIKSNLNKYKFSRYFYLKSIMKLSYYNYLINFYPSKAIIGYSEFSFTSSLLTEFCHVCGIKHINIMHGEKNFDITNAFSTFDKFYVWDEFYIELFESLHIISKFIIELPPSLIWCENDMYNSAFIDYTYYLTNPNEQVLNRTIEILGILFDSGYKVAIRPHPRYTNIEKLRMKCGLKIEIENTQDLDIKKSIMRTQNIISDFSTVLLQGLLAKKKIIIDDMSDPKIFSKMIEYKYGIVYKEKNYEKLSDILKKESKT